MVLSNFVKRRAVSLFHEGLKAPAIAKALGREGIRVSHVSVHKLLVKYEKTGSVTRQAGSGRSSKVTDAIKTVVKVKAQMRKDDETTANQLQKVLLDRGIDISLRNILRCRKSLGWTYRGSAYCQLIRDANRAKRLVFARKILEYNFEDVIFTDECTVQMETHRRFCCRKKGEAPAS